MKEFEVLRIVLEKRFYQPIENEFLIHKAPIRIVPYQVFPKLGLETRNVLVFGSVLIFVHIVKKQLSLLLGINDLVIDSVQHIGILAVFFLSEVHGFPSVLFRSEERKIFRFGFEFF